MIKKITLYHLLIITAFFFMVIGSIAQESTESMKTMRGIEASGTFAPVGPPLSQPVRIGVGKSCVVVDMKMSYAVSGTFTGSMEIDYRIFVEGPCGSPPGTFDEEWIALGTFTGLVNGSEVTGNLIYTAHVKKGGDVKGRIILGKGLNGELHVQGNFSEGKLFYKGVLNYINNN